MPSAIVNGTRLFYNLTGSKGPPLVLVHGSWGDHHNWDRVVPALAAHCRVLVYDRRGHSQSERPAGLTRVDQHVDDLAALIEYLDLAPAHVAGSSFGGYITLRLALRRPDLFRGLAVHEPPLLSLLNDEPEFSALRRETETGSYAVLDLLRAGDFPGGARLFVETVAFGPGAWDQMPEKSRQTFVNNAPTFLSDGHDPAGLNVDLAALSGFPRPVLLTGGDASMPFYRPILIKLAKAMPWAETRMYADAGHVPHLSHPTDYASVLSTFVAAANTDGNTASIANSQG